MSHTRRSLGTARIDVVIMWRRPLLLLALCLFTIASTVTSRQQTNAAHHPSHSGSEPALDVRKQWNLINFNLPYDFPANNKEFNDPEGVVATGLAVDYDRIFVATPRLFSGVPATLSVVPRNGPTADSPVLQAYPNWSFHTAGTKQYNCSDLGLVSVYRIRIDKCDRLWALDAGVSRSLEDYEVTCPPKILVIDTRSDQVVRRIDFPREVVRGETLFTNLVIDDTMSRPENNCDDVFIYISDTVEPGIVVYDSGKDLTWRLSHPSMYPDPNFAQSTILGQRFTLMDGIVGLAFDKKTSTVYYQPLATDRMFSVHTSALRAGPLAFGAELPVKLVGKKSSQGIGLAISPSDGSIFFSPMSETAVAKWNPTANYQKVLAYDPEQLQFVADIRTTERDPGAIYVLSSRFHRYFLKNLNPGEANVRIMRLNELHHDEIATAGGPSNVPSNSINFKHQHQFTLGAPSGPKTTAQRTTAASLGPSSYVSSLPPPFYATQPHPQATRQQTQPQSAIGVPYRFEQVGVINKAVQNPFAALNTGERPDGGHHAFATLRRGKFGTVPAVGLEFAADAQLQQLYEQQQPIASFQPQQHHQHHHHHDFNGLRFAKSAPNGAHFNASTVN